MYPVTFQDRRTSYGTYAGDTSRGHGREHLGQRGAGRIGRHDAVPGRPGFFGFEMWRQALATKAQLLWRIKKNAALACDKRLTDGSYLSRIYPCEKDRTHQTNSITVRVIEYRLQGVADAEPIYRLVACRRGRRNKRGVKRKMSNWPLRRSHSTPQQPVNIRQTIQIVK